MVAEIFVLVVAFVLFGIGIIGCIAPVLPGPPVAFIGLLGVHFFTDYQFGTTALVVLGIISFGIVILDNFIPVVGAKKMGGTKYGVWGSMIGLIIGFFLPPVGILIGPFIGALVGELIGGQTKQKAVKAATGAFLGFLVGTFAKFIVCFIIGFYLIRSTYSIFVS